jgi:hypothetical protein
MMMNTIVFDPLYIPHILTGKITATVRLWPLARVTPNDTIMFVDAYQRKPFAIAKISLIETKRFSEFTDDDKNATQIFDRFNNFARIMESFYGETITPETEFRIVHFVLIDDGQQQIIDMQNQTQEESNNKDESQPPKKKRS